MSNEAQQHESQNFIIGDLVKCSQYPLPRQSQSRIELEKSKKTIYVLLGTNIEDYSCANLLSPEGIVVVVPYIRCINLSKCIH